MQTRWRIATGTGIALGLAALPASLHPRIDPAVGMVGTIIVAATVVLALTHRWLDRLGQRITDTTQERRRLQELTAQCQVAQIAHTTLREQLIADKAAVERAADDRSAAAEAAAEKRIADTTAQLRQAFEDSRATLIAEAYFEGAMNERNGAHTTASSQSAKLIYLAERRVPPRDAALGTQP